MFFLFEHAVSVFNFQFPIAPCSLSSSLCYSLNCGLIPPFVSKFHVTFGSIVNSKGVAITMTVLLECLTE